MKLGCEENTLIGCESDFSDAELVILGAPFDGTTSFRPGARFAPSQMRIESVGIETYSPYFDADLTDFKICDYGNLLLPFGTTERALQLIQEQARSIFQQDRGRTSGFSPGHHGSEKKVS